MEKKIIFMILFLGLSINIVSAESIITTEEYWKAGNSHTINIQAEKEYDDGFIKITDNFENIIFEGELEKISGDNWYFTMLVPTNEISDVYNINIRMLKYGYPVYKKEFKVQIKEMNIFDRIIMFLRTHVPLISQY